jgi:hypothetical protein
MKRLSIASSLFLIFALHSAAALAMVVETVQMEKGWRIEVTRSVGMEGTENYQNGYQAPFRIFQKIQFKDQVTKTDGKVIQEVDRTIETAEFNSLDLESGQMVKQEIIPSGSRFRVSHTPYGSTLFNGNSGEEIWDEDIVSAFSPPIVPNLWPEGELGKGKKWSYHGDELTSRIALLDILGGKIDLSVEDIKEEPSTHLMTALIRGKLQTKVDLGNIVMDFNADVSIDLPLPLGIPFMVKFDGTLLGSGTAQDQYGQPIGFQAKASGTYLQIAKPTKEIFDSIASGIGTKKEKMEVTVEKGRIDGSGAIRLPLNNHHSSQGVPSSKKGGGGPVYQYRLYQDVTENAFTVLVPEGWQVQGGIMRIPPNQIRTVVDGCGKKLHFSIYDPVTHASITYFPTEMYATSAPGTSVINLPAGQVLNGMVQMPQLLSPSQYVRRVVFPSERSDAQNVQWGKIKSLSSLASAWNRAFHAEDQIPPQIVAESIEVAYDRGNMRFGELWTSLITSVTVNNSTIWMPDFTVVASAPLDKADQLAPILKAVITSFRMNSTWMANTSAAFDKCTKGVAATQEQIRAIDRKISQKLRQVQKEINRIDNEIVANRNNTRSVIQEHEHNTLMGEDKYEDTETGARYLIDMGYERNFTNGEQIIQTNDWTYAPPAGYRDMKNVHITDE